MFFGEQARLAEHSGMGNRRLNVVRRQHPIEMSGFAQCRQRRGWAAGEPAAPQRAFVGAHLPERSLCAEILEDRP
ncbi:Uncharacterised protein [Mycobacteroides abscessus subsp. abscessus]|nr:Uncharacterised protein [Mycobacteroides abscessus subsp. abscessus]